MKPELLIRSRRGVRFGQLPVAETESHDDARNGQGDHEDSKRRATTPPQSLDPGLDDESAHQCGHRQHDDGADVRTVRAASHGLDCARAVHQVAGFSIQPGGPLELLRVRKTLRVLWTAAFVAGFVLIVIPGKPDGLQRPREILAGLLIAGGTLLAFARTPNRRAQLADDEDLEIYSIGFLALGASLPLIRSFSGSGRVWPILLGAVWLMGFIAILVWEQLARRRDGRLPAQQQPSRATPPAAAPPIPRPAWGLSRWRLALVALLILGGTPDPCDQASRRSGRSRRT